ncbi:hypothetical protein PI124_g6694 [Phytophthora idaei]|nr:hypothetical protein PI125_g6305 [Phytophthora idaei]KAG3162189.1 hypothetical protein PI126_g6087 [Phytophthora idaei]KAG3248657.1 hypothetical protein PI124_g6694 [Phytophthora idaei]
MTIVSEATAESSAAPTASPSVSRAFTPQTALPDIREDTLRDIVEETARTASARSLKVSAAQLAPVTKVLVQAIIRRLRSNGQAFWDRFNQTQTIEEVSAAIPAGTLRAFDTSSDVGELRARLEAVYVGRKSVGNQLLRETNRRENAELFARQATTEIQELKAEFKRVHDSDAAHHKKALDAQAMIDSNTGAAAKFQKLVEYVQADNVMLQKQVFRERKVFKAKLAANTS